MAITPDISTSLSLRNKHFYQNADGWHYTGNGSLVYNGILFPLEGKCAKIRVVVAMMKGLLSSYTLFET